MSVCFVCYLFLYLIERDFQKLISSSLEEKVGIAFNSMIDRSGKDGTTEGITVYSKTTTANHTGVDLRVFNRALQEKIQKAEQTGAQRNSARRH